MPIVPAERFPARLRRLGYTWQARGDVECIIPPLLNVAAGHFLMGSDVSRDHQAWASEMPQHRVEVAAFRIGTYPVTVAEYALAVRAGIVSEPPSCGGISWLMQLRYLEYPVGGVSWQDAMAYSGWLCEVTSDPGWRLPTEAEWEKAARWDPHANVSRIYPWGDTFDGARCNVEESGRGEATPVGAYRANDPRRSGANPWVPRTWRARSGNGLAPYISLTHLLPLAGVKTKVP